MLGHEGAGVVEAVGEGVRNVSPGDRVVFAMVVPCGQCEPCRSGHRTLCVPAGTRGFAGTMADGTSRLAGADDTPLQHGFGVACFAEYAVLQADAVVPIPDGVPLWQAALLGCGVLTGFGAVGEAARVRIADAVCVVGCGGVGLQVVAAAALAGARTVVAVDRRPEKLGHALRRGATHVVDAAQTEDPAAEVRALTNGGVHYAFEVVGTASTLRLAWDALRPGGQAVVVGLAPTGVEVSIPAIEFLSEKSIIGSYYGSADPVLSLRNLVELSDAGRLYLDDMVSHLIELEQIPEAMDRLRRGEGDRSVVILDSELAGAVASGARTPVDTRERDMR